MIYASEDWPYGLRCLDCERKFLEGDLICRRLTGITEDGTFQTEIVCPQCDLEGALTA